MNLVGHDLGGVELLEGERVDLAIDMTSGDGNRSSKTPDRLLLTSSRIIRLSGSGRGRHTDITSVDDVDSVQITAVREGIGAYVWAGLAVVLSVILYATIDHAIGRVAAPLIVFAMGVYLVVNHLLESGKPTVVFRSGHSEIRWVFDARDDVDDVHRFVARLYEIKESSRPDRDRRFAPR